MPHFSAYETALACIGFVVHISPVVAVCLFPSTFWGYMTSNAAIKTLWYKTGIVGGFLGIVLVVFPVVLGSSS